MRVNLSNKPEKDIADKLDEGLSLGEERSIFSDTPSGSRYTLHHKVIKFAWLGFLTYLFYLIENLMFSFLVFNINNISFHFITLKFFITFSKKKFSFVLLS